MDATTAPEQPERTERPSRRWPSYAYLAAAAALFITLSGVAHFTVGIVPMLCITFFSVLIAMILHAPMALLARYIPRPIAALLVFGAVAGSVALLTKLSAPLVIDQGQRLVRAAPRATHRLEEWLKTTPLAQLGGGESFVTSLHERMGRAAASLLSQAVPWAIAVVSTVGTAVLVFALAMYLAYSPRPYLLGMLRLVPKRHERTAAELIERVGCALRRWIWGTLAAMTVVGVITAVGLLILGIDTWLVLGILAFVGEFVPYLGPLFAAVPAIAAGLLISPAKGVQVALLFVFVQQLENHIVTPLAMKRAVNIQPALLIVWQLMVAHAFGLLALLVSAPLLAAVQVAIEYLYVERTLGRKDESIERKERDPSMPPWARDEEPPPRFRIPPLPGLRIPSLRGLHHRGVATPREPTP